LLLLLMMMTMLVLPQVRMPEGDSVVLDDSDEPGSSSNSRRKAGAAVQGDVIDAEFRDLN
jgi:hypothetical protein